MIPQKEDEEEATSKQQKPVAYSAATSIDSGHRSSVTYVSWLPLAYQVNYRGKFVSGAKHCTQIMSGASDGMCMIWDTRNDPKDHPDGVPYKDLHLAWKPFVKVKAPQMTSSSFADIVVDLPLVRH